MHKMHTKYSKTTLLSSRHDYEVNKFHKKLIPTIAEPIRIVY